MLTKYDAIRMNRDQAMNLEIWFNIHTKVSNFETASPKILQIFMIQFSKLKKCLVATSYENLVAALKTLVAKLIEVI